MQFFTGSKSSKKVNSIFLARSQRSQHTNSTFFAWLNKLHNIQSSFLQIEKDAKIIFVFMKNEFIIWGASALRLSGPFGPAPHMMNSFFMKTKTIFASFSVCKKLDWMLCNLFNHAKKSGIRVLWALWPCKKNWIHFFWAFEPVKKWIPFLLAFFIAKNCVSNKLFFLNKRPVRYK